jgi:hypothetical protein
MVTEITVKCCQTNKTNTIEDNAKCWGFFFAGAIKMAEDHKDFVIGFICQSRLTEDYNFVHMTPGILSFLKWWVKNASLSSFYI